MPADCVSGFAVPAEDPSAGPLCAAVAGRRAPPADPRGPRTYEVSFFGSAEITVRAGSREAAADLAEALLDRGDFEAECWEVREV